MLKFARALIVGALFLFPGHALAAAAGPSGFYFGADAVFDDVSLKAGVPDKSPNALYGVNLYAGYEVLQGISVEVGYEGRFSSASLASATEQGGHADAVFRVPLTDWADLKAGGGLNYIASVANVTTLESFAAFHSFNWGWHIFAGPEITLTPSVGWRTLLTYQQGGFGAAGSGDLIVSSGLAWHI